MILLIHPPVAKPSEPPLGLARLAGALEAHDIPYGIIDANLEGLLFLLKQPLIIEDTWTKRAHRGLAKDLAYIREGGSYKSPDRYKSAVLNLNRLLAAASANYNCLVSLANYTDKELLPQKSRDLMAASDHYQENVFYPYFKARLEPAIRALQPDYIGISVNFLNQALCVFALAGFLRSVFPGIELIAGGSLISSWMSSPGWRNPFGGIFGHLIAGPGEEPLLSLLTGRTSDNGGRAEVYSPSFKKLPIKEYLAPGLILPYNTSSGCLWNRCSFCPEPAEKNRYKPLPVGIAHEQLGQLVKTTGASLIHLADNAVSPAFMQALIRSPAGAPWYGFARFLEQLADPGFCRQLKESGCVMLELGLESGDPQVLAGINKGINLEMASLVLKNLRQAGIISYVYLLFGTPDEDYEKAQATLAYVAAHAHLIGYLNLSLFNMPVACSLAEEYETTPFYRADLALYTDFVHPAGWGREHVRRFLEYEFKKHPAIRPVVRRKPPVFTSNHAAFFMV